MLSHFYVSFFVWFLFSICSQINCQQIATGYLHTCALTSGAVYCWGANSQGQIGDGSSVATDRLTPSLVWSSGVAQLSGYGHHTCVITTGASMYCWGWNSNGQIGDNTAGGINYVPTMVSGMSSGVTAMANGWQHTCAIKSGLLYCWGYNYYGQIGDGTLIDKYVPVAVSLSSVTAVAGGFYHTCAIVTGGNMYCWGYNDHGQLGDGTLINQLSPVLVAGVSSIVAMSPAYYHTCALTSSGAVYCWGTNSNGELGDGTAVARSTPQVVPTLSSGVSKVTSSYQSSFALTSSGIMYGWGLNSYGQLGDGTVTNKLVPTQFGSLTGVTLISGSIYHSCVVITGGTVYCSGYNSNGQLGDGTITQRLSPILMPNLVVVQPTASPTKLPTVVPTASPSFRPTAVPSFQPTVPPTVSPTVIPTKTPTFVPTYLPTSQPSSSPTRQPSRQPTGQPSRQPTSQPTNQPSRQPSMQPTAHPSCQPTCQPSLQPFGSPTSKPSNRPTTQPSLQPLAVPTGQPSTQPSIQPSRQPSVQPSEQPSAQPSCQPSLQPFGSPTAQPSRQPTLQPSRQPSAQPSAKPSCQPSRQPTSQPSRQPSRQPTLQPSCQPSLRPSRQPSGQPSVHPSTQPTVQPSQQPTSQPTSQPSRQPSGQPSVQPSTQPTVQPSQQPSAKPSGQPSMQPSSQPSSQPTRQPSRQPTAQPSIQPSCQPSSRPSGQPTAQPSIQPSSQPSSQPTKQPSLQPSSQPSLQPSVQPTSSPSCQPSIQPSAQPSAQPNSQPSTQPSAQPSLQPSRQPTSQPTLQPSWQPSSQPSSQPSLQPSSQPTCQPSGQPSRQPTLQPTGQPSRQPSSIPSIQPSGQPTSQPSRQPTAQPSSQPTEQPSHQPTWQPSSHPTRQPSTQPSGQPTIQPSMQPSAQPTTKPSRQPSSQPSRYPTMQPSAQPTSQPTTQPSRQPTSQPSTQPSCQPSIQPSTQPSRQPSSQPSEQPTSQPSGQPSVQPISQPSRKPSGQPSSFPSTQPSVQPTSQPTSVPSSQPSVQPTLQPSRQPTSVPTSQPTLQPSLQPTMQPTGRPTIQPSSQPSSKPSRQPSSEPTNCPSSRPSLQPSSRPSCQPSTYPSSQPSSQPSRQPSVVPTSQPTCQPSGVPSLQPSRQPTMQPTSQPSCSPTSQPVTAPSCRPTSQPTGQPSYQPSQQPSSFPSSQPSSQPSAQPSHAPSYQPSVHPTNQPTRQPTTSPTSQPTSKPTSQPSTQPLSHPSSMPSAQPTRQPSGYPTSQPIGVPSCQPSRQPSSRPSRQPSRQPTSSPSRSIASEIQDSDILKLSDAMIVLSDSPYIALQFSADTNCAGGASAFPCNELLNITGSAGDLSFPLDFLSSCRWLSTTTIKITGNVNMQLLLTNRALSFLRVNMLRNTPLAALPSMRVSYASQLLSIQYPSTSSVQARSPAVSLVSKYDSTRGLLLLTLGYVPASGDPLSHWTRGNFQVNIYNSNVAANVSQVLRNLSSLISFTLSRKLPDAILSRQVTLRLTETSLLRVVEQWRLNNTALEFSFSLELCDGYDFCGHGMSTSTILGLTALSSISTIPRLLVSLSSYPIWNQSCNVPVSIKSAVHVQSNISVASVLTSTSYLTFEWFMKNSSYSTAYVATASNSKDLSIFRLPKNSLQMGNLYSLILRVRDPTGLTEETSPMQLTCTLPSLVVNVVPAQKRFELRLLEQFTLNASTSYDPVAPWNTANLEYLWKCRSFLLSDLGRASLSWLSEATRQRLALPRCMVNLTSPTTKITLRSPESSPVVLITATARESVNTTSEVTLIVRDRTQLSRPSVSTSTEIQIISSLPPVSIRLQTTRSALSRINSQKSIILQAEVRQGIDNGLQSQSVRTADWSWSSDISNSLLRTMTTNNVTRFVLPGSSSWTNTHLSLKAGVLTSGAYYLFRLSCGSSVMDVEVTTNAVPSGGNFAVSPNSGWTLETLFTLTASSWRDNDEDYPLRYAFSVYEHPYRSVRSSTISLTGTWTVIPNDGQWYLEAVYLPAGMMNQSYVVRVKCVVSDSLEGSTSIGANSTVFPYRSWTTASSTAVGRRLLLSMALPPSQVIVESMSTLVSNVSVASSAMRLQQTITAVTVMLRQDMQQGSSGMFSTLNSQERMELATLLASQVNVSLVKTDIEQEPAAVWLLGNISQLIGDTKVAIAQEASAKALQSLGQKLNNGTSVVSSAALASQTASLMSSLAQSLLSNSGGSEPQTVQVVTETVKLSLALVSVPPIDPNATTVQYLPPLGVPDSKSTINIAQNAGASGSAMISVAAYDASLFQAALAAKAVNSTSTSDGLPKPTLSSDIISISVSYTGDSGEAVLPSFVANMEVEDEGFVAPYFQHNCTVGSVETLSFLCPKSLVRMNLTCSGKAAANVRRRCPVPQQVCNVLSMSDLSVASASYCHAFPNSDSTVTCICGMDNSESGKNSSSQLSSLLGSGAAINVAVMTQFVAGDFGGTVVGGTGNIDASLATKSQIIFVSFGLLWGFGVISMIVHFYDLDFSVFGFGKKDGKALKIEAANPALSATKQRDGLQMNDAIARASQAKQKAYDTMKKYLVSVLPTIYHPVPWLIRLKDQLFHHHKYISFFTFLISMVGYIIPMKMKRHIQQHRTEQDMMSDEQKRKKSVLQVAYMLSAITISCFTLSVLYDIQYPADDGSCVSHVTESSCLLRKTVLDPSRSYCKWVPFTQGSAGSITESREGKIIQSIPLESVLVETDHIQCVFDDSDASGMAMLTALLITTMVTLPFDTVLKLIFQLLAVKSDKEVKLRAQVKETMLSRGIKAADEANMSSSIQRGGRRGGILVTTNPDVVTKELIKNVVKEANSKTSELSPAEATSIDAENSVIVRQSRLSKLRNIFKVKVAIKTPTVIQRIHQARKDSLEKWSALHDWQLYGASRKKFYANRKQLMQMLQTLTSLTRSATLQKQEVKFQQDRFEFCTRQLQNATHEEFGMTVLQTLYMDILDQETPIGNRFQRVLYKDFPIEKYVSEKLQWFLMGVVACLVLGALFYVILKGSGRGQAWQRALLRICFLDWFIEVIVHQTFEVYFVHFLLPNLIYEDVQMTLAALLRSYAALVHDTMKYRGTVPVGELTLRTALAEQQPSPSLDSYSTLLVTQQAVLAAVVEKRALMESQLTMYFNSNRFFANEDEMPRQSFVLPRRMNPILSYVLQGLFVISGFPIPLQRVMGGLISSALFSAMSTMWIAMKHVRASGGIMATVVIVMTMLIAAGLIYWHRRTLFYYLSASYMPRKIAAIAPVAHTLDELDKEEEEEKKDGGPDSDDENGSHWSWSGSDSESAIESRDDSSKASHSTHMSSAVSEQSSIWQDDTARQMIASMLYPSMYDSPDVFELGMYGPNMMFMPSLDFEEATEMVDMTIPEMELNANLFQSMDSMDSPKNADIMEEKDMDFIDSFHQQMFGVPFSPSQMLHIPLDSRSDDYSGSSIDSTRDDDCRSMGTFGSDSPHHSHYYRIPSMTVPMYHYDLHNEIYLEPMQDAMLVAPRNMGLIPNQDTLYTLSSQSKGADMHVKPQHNVVLMQPTSALDSALDSDFDADFLNGGDRNVSNM